MSLGPAAPALLLVHGWGGDGREWSGHAETLADRFHVIVPDPRGHGRSEVPEQGDTPPETADDLAALVDLLAVRHPELVRAVVSFDPAHGAHGREMDGIPGRLAACREQGARVAPDFVAVASGSARTARRTCSGQRSRP
ncbi:alpha/beta fold hydrolase [Streptomyces sp. NPDC001107]